MATTYAEKLKDPRWQKLRLQILERDNWTCQYCFSESKTLHVHHRHYEDHYDNPFDYPPEYLITACEECHKKEPPQIKEIEKNIIRNIRLKVTYQCEYESLSAFLAKCDHELLFRLFDTLADTHITPDDIMEKVMELHNLRHQREIERRKKLPENA